MLGDRGLRGEPGQGHVESGVHVDLGLALLLDRLDHLLDGPHVRAPVPSAGRGRHPEALGQEAVREGLQRLPGLLRADPLEVDDGLRSRGPRGLIGARRALDRVVVPQLRTVREQVEAGAQQRPAGGAGEHDDGVLQHVLGIGASAGSRAADGDDPVVEPLQQRAQAVRRVRHPVAADLPVVPPGAPAVGGGVPRLHLVDVLALAVVELAEDARGGHRAHDEVRAGVAVVLRHPVQRRAAAHGGDERVGLAAADDGGHLAEHVDAGLERGDGLRGVVVLRRGEHDEVDGADELLEGVAGALRPVLADEALARRLVRVVDRHEPRAVAERAQAVDEAAAADGSGDPDADRRAGG